MTDQTPDDVPAVEPARTSAQPTDAGEPARSSAPPPDVDGAEPVSAAVPPTDPRADPTPPRGPRSTGPVQYKGSDLEPELGPGLGCFRIQLIVLVIFIVLTPLTVVWNWPVGVSAALLFAVLGLLLVTGQTIIFLLRLVAADRRGRRRPLASGSKTVGELEDSSEPPVDDETPPEPQVATARDEDDPPR